MAGRVHKHIVMRLGLVISAMLVAFGRATTVSTLPGGQSLGGALLAQNYAQEVDRRLTIPETEQQAWASLLSVLLADKEPGPQYVVFVDRNPFIQAVAIYWIAPDGTFHFIGASPVSTGKPGSFDHFVTPTGVFEHTVANPDFRAEGTRNENGILGYGRKGMRVYDFGWQQAERGWGHGGEATMRLQMHATDPTLLERRLGTIQSKGCIRIPATLDTFIDRHAILDADYQDAIAAGQTFSVLSKTRESTPWSGRYLVIVDTGRTSRPAWSPPPGVRQRISPGRHRYSQTIWPPASVAGDSARGHCAMPVQKREFANGSICSGSFVRIFSEREVGARDRIIRSERIVVGSYRSRGAAHST